jgi:hypothetical protein
MKVQFLAAILAGVLLISSIATSAFCLWYVWSSRQNMRIQAEVVRLSALGNAVRAVLVESAEYSKRNPAMVPLLQTWNVLPRTGATNPPATTPLRSPLK